MYGFLSAVIALAMIAIYYVTVWYFSGRDPKPGTVVIQYEPPRNLSPAMMRYVWVQRYDERALWSLLVSFVSKGLAVLETIDGTTIIRPVRVRSGKPSLEHEESLWHLVAGWPQRGTPVSLLEPRMAELSYKLAAKLRVEERGRWFSLNLKEVFGGAMFSALVLLVVFLLSVPYLNLDSIGSFAAAIALVSVSAYYLYFLSQRLIELAGVLRRNPGTALIRRSSVFAIMALGATTGIITGLVILGYSFGISLVIVTVGALALNALFLYLMKAPTLEGRKLLDEIEGFRRFLQSVEQLPLDRPDAPSNTKGLYEKYLPYALALEVEQQWCDKFNVLASTEALEFQSHHSNLYCIGMWNGRPIEVAYVPSRK